MATFNLVDSEKRLITSDLAREFAQMLGSATERTKEEKRMDYIRGQVAAGHAVTFHWATAERPDGTIVRVNGQHSSDVLSKLDGDMPQNLTVNIDRYKVDGPEGEVLLFRQFDTKHSLRSTLDISGAYQGIVPQLKDVPRQPAKWAADGIAWYLKRVVGVPVSKGEERYDLFHHDEYTPFVVWIGHVLTIKTREMRQAPVLAAAFATFDRDPDAAREFWRQVSRGGEEFAEKAPSSVLDKWLVDVQNKEVKRAKVKETQLYQGCLYCWNAHRTGKEALERVNFDVRKGFFEVE